jgi:hypothetical protein
MDVVVAQKMECRFNLSIGFRSPNGSPSTEDEPLKIKLKIMR